MSCSGNYIKWIYELFGECISTTKEKIGFGFGFASTIIWMYAQFPQIHLNFRRHSAEGLSVGFLALLIAGDVANLLGLIITGGLLTQKLSSIWYLIADIACISQACYYNWIRPRCCRKSNENQVLLAAADENGNDALLAIPLLFAMGDSKLLSEESIDPYKSPHLYGMILGWISAVAYLSSRLPQIIKNFRRKKTEGVSCQFFVTAVLGNTSYGLSIFLKDHHWPYIWRQFPWLVGSLGVLVFDFLLILQFLFYDYRKRSKDVSTITDLSSAVVSSIESAR